MIIDEESYLAHEGTKRHSGRYPWGSGEDPYQHEPFYDRVNSYKKVGLTEAEIAKLMQMTTTQLRARKAVAYQEQLAAKQAMAARLKAKGYSPTMIAKRMNLPNESSARSLLNPSSQARAKIAFTIANNLKETMGDSNAVMIGKGVELYLGASQDKLKVAVAMLEDEGYKVHHIYTTQLGTGHKTDIKVLAPPGVTTRELYQDRDRIKGVTQSLDETHEGGVGFRKPVSISTDRIMVRYAEDGGTERDGTMQIRPGAKDLELGDYRYAQVRIGVNNSHYMKGMAVYGDPKDFPPGKDIIVNSNKKRGTPVLGEGDNSVLKPMKRVKNPDGSKGDIDWDNPFGAAIKLGVGQYDYEDPKTGKKKQSAINIVNEEGSWNTWSKNLPSQMLSKQDISLAKKQLGIELDRHKRSLDEIENLTNPVVKRKLLTEYASEVDSAAVHMKAAAMPRQRTQVILPIPSMKDTEIYAPNFKNGERVVLIRFPHGGKFEIPELVVNNKNKDAISVLGNAKDAVGINAKVAERLSGADFDGDSVLVIPNNRREIKTEKSLPGLKDFDPKTAYPKYPGMKVMTKKQKGKEMGVVSNLITDMHIKGAPLQDIEKAVRHSMVVIDAEKHELNWKQSERDNQIDLLKEKWQSQPGGKSGGASTLISRATSEQRVPSRKPRLQRHGGPINPKTGEKEYEYTKDSYDEVAYRVRSGTNKDGTPRYRKQWATESKFRTLQKQGEIPTDAEIIERRTKTRTMTSTKMAEAKDAYSLSSGSEMESVYANYANSLKALGNKARKSSLEVGSFKYDPDAAKKYSTEVSSLNAKLNTALKNKPLENKAQLIAGVMYDRAQTDHPEYDKDDLKKLRGKYLAKARSFVGAGKQAVYITDKEWEAIQARAISANKLKEIIDNANPDRVKELATPKLDAAMSTTMLSRAHSMLTRGYTQAEVADRLGVSVSTLIRNL